MPNILTSIFVSNPATEPVEAPHPNTGVYVTGTQATVGGPWTVTHTLVTKTTTPLTIIGRLKNFPAVTVSVVASGGPFAGNIFNNVLATPTGTGATATSTTALNVVVSSISNQTGYRLLAADAVGGPFTQIYQGTTASYPHTGLTAGQTKYYQWQYVGGGYYDDSALSTPPFSGVTSAAAAAVVLTPADSQYQQNPFVSPALRGGNDFLAVQYSGAAYVDVTFASTIFATGPRYAVVGVNDGGTWAAPLTATQAAQQTVRVTLAGSGLLKVYDGNQRIIDDTPANGRIGTAIAQLSFPSGSTASVTAQVASADCVYFIGDSISSGEGSSFPNRYASGMVLRGLLGYDCYLETHGYRSYLRSLNTAQQVTDQISRIAAVFGSRTGKKTVAVALGTNDVNYGTVAAMQTAVLGLINQLRSLYPTWNVVLFTPAYTASGFNASPNAQGLLDLASARPWLVVRDCRAVYGAAGLDTVDTTNLVHPNNTGANALGTFYYNAITALPAMPPQETYNLRLENTNAGWVEAGAVWSTGPDPSGSPDNSVSYTPTVGATRTIRATVNGYAGLYGSQHANCGTIGFQIVPSTGGAAVYSGTTYVGSREYGSALLLRSPLLNGTYDFIVSNAGPTQGGNQVSLDRVDITPALPAFPVYVAPVAAGTINNAQLIYTNAWTYDAATDVRYTGVLGATASSPISYATTKVGYWGSGGAGAGTVSLKLFDSNNVQVGATATLDASTATTTIQELLFVTVPAGGGYYKAVITLTTAAPNNIRSFVFA